MKKPFITKAAFLLLFTAFYLSAQAQNNSTDSVLHTRAQNLFIEAGGPGLALSINYDTRFCTRRDGWGFRIGDGYFASNGNTVFTVPFQLNYLIPFGDGTDFLELGAGGTFVNSTGDNTDKTFIFDKVTGIFASGTIGYRIQPKHKGINFRLAFVPIYWDEGFLPIGGLSIGYTFK